mgnify:CR=1 FL=1
MTISTQTRECINCGITRPFHDFPKPSGYLIARYSLQDRWFLPTCKTCARQRLNAERNNAKRNKES